MKFLKQCESFKKPLLEHYFINFLKDLSIEDLVALCELLTTKIAKSLRRIYATLGRRVLVSQYERNKFLQSLVNWWTIGPPPKPWEMWDNKKRWRLDPWW